MTWQPVAQKSTIAFANNSHRLSTEFARCQDLSG